MPDWLLVRHFLTKFIDNDLLSPDVDRHSVLAVTLSAVLTSGLFVTVLLSSRYLFHPLQSRGWTAVVALNDSFLACGYAMVVMGLVAVTAWDSVALDARDTAILSPLPVARGRVVAAQAAALLAFALAFDVALNAIPMTLAPFVRVSRLPIHLGGLLRLIAASATSTMAAGMLGFLAVIALRESLRALLGAARFDRIAPLVQGVLVALLATVFLVLPAASSRVDDRFLDTHAWVPPPMWFVGLQEHLTAGAVVGLPATEPPADAPAAPQIRRSEERMMRRYASRVGALQALATRATLALALVGFVAAAAWAWNSRRWPPLPTRRWARDSRRSRLLLAVERRAAPTPLQRAGFAFARQTMTRSVTHRVRLAAACGAALACAAGILRGLDPAALDPTDLPPAIFAVQTAIVLVLAVGYRQVTRVQADVRPPTTFQTAGLSETRSYVEGVKRAGIILFIAPVLCLVWPLHAAVMGWVAASSHLVWGVLLLLIAMEWLFTASEDIPLVSPRRTIDNSVARSAMYGVAGVAAVWALAALERLGAGSVPRTLLSLGVLLAVWVAQIVSARRGTPEPRISWTLQDDAGGQRLGLGDQ